MCSCEEWVWVATVHATPSGPRAQPQPRGREGLPESRKAGRCRVTFSPVHVLSLLGNLGNSRLLPLVAPQPFNPLSVHRPFPHPVPHLPEATQVSCYALWLSAVERSSKHVYERAINLWCSFYRKLKAFPTVGNEDVIPSKR